MGRRPATVLPFIMVPGDKQMRRLVFIRGDRVEWDEPGLDFESAAHAFALALAHDKRIQNETVTLIGGGAGRGIFALFGLENDPDLYFATSTVSCIRMPCKFQMQLILQPEDQPLSRSNTYEVNAKKWDDFTVRDITSKAGKKSRLARLRKFLKQS